MFVWMIFSCRSLKFAARTDDLQKLHFDMCVKCKRALELCYDVEVAFNLRFASPERRQEEEKTPKNVNSHSPTPNAGIR